MQRSSFAAVLTLTSLNAVSANLKVGIMSDLHLNLDYDS